MAFGQNVLSLFLSSDPNQRTRKGYSELWSGPEWEGRKEPNLISLCSQHTGRQRQYHQMSAQALFAPEKGEWQRANYLKQPNKDWKGLAKLQDELNQYGAARRARKGRALQAGPRPRLQARLLPSQRQPRGRGAGQQRLLRLLGGSLWLGVRGLWQPLLQPERKLLPLDPPSRYELLQQLLTLTSSNDPPFTTVEISKPRCHRNFFTFSKSSYLGAYHELPSSGKGPRHAGTANALLFALIVTQPYTLWCHFMEPLITAENLC